MIASNVEELNQPASWISLLLYKTNSLINSSSCRPLSYVRHCCAAPRSVNIATVNRVITNTRFKTKISTKNSTEFMEDSDELLDITTEIQVCSAIYHVSKSCSCSSLSK